MAINLTDEQNERVRQYVAGRRATWYTMFGLPVCSEIELPVPQLPAPYRAIPAWRFRLLDSTQAVPEPDGPIVGIEPCPWHGVEQIVHRGPGGAWLWRRGVGTCHIQPGNQVVDVYPERDADERALGLMLAGQVSVYLLHQLGRPTLHASAVGTAHGVAAFLGAKGRGKSTMAASFLLRGAELVTDDVLPLHARPDGIYASPGLPIMKLWREAAASTLGFDGELEELVPQVEFDKKLLRVNGHFRFAAAPARVRALYLLDRGGELLQTSGVSIRRLSQRESLTVLLTQVSEGAYLRPKEVARFLPLYARLASEAPVRLVAYPNSFDDQEHAFRAIMADLEELGS